MSLTNDQLRALTNDQLWALTNDQLRALFAAVRRQREQAEDQTYGWTLHECLQNCHDPTDDIEAGCLITGTEGVVAGPDERVRFESLQLFIDFRKLQKAIWSNILSPSDQPSDQPFGERRLFPSKNFFRELEKKLKPVETEAELARFLAVAVEKPVSDIINALYGDNTLRGRLGLVGTVGFKSHRNQLEETSSSSSESGGLAQTNSLSKGQPDKFCMYRRDDDGSYMAVLAIQYKSPHKLLTEDVTNSLQGNIPLTQDFINKNDPKDPLWMVVDVVAQLFSHLVSLKLRYGYVCTGCVYIFIRIDEVDPKIVEYYVSNQKNDVKKGESDFVHYTAAAEIVAFTLQALAAEKPTPEWINACDNLDRWVIENPDRGSQSNEPQH